MKPEEHVTLRQFYIGSALAAMAKMPTEEFEVRQICQKAIQYAETVIALDPVINNG